MYTKLVLLGLVLGLTVGAMSASAQDAGAARGHHGIGQVLGLSDAQRAQIRSIREQAHQRADAIRQSTQGEAQGQALRQLHQQTREQMRGVLTPDQQQRMTQMRGRHQGRGHHGMRGMRMRAMAERLQLTDAQRTNIRTIMQQSHTQARTLRSQYPQGSEQARTALRTLREQTRAQIDAQLTPAQRAMIPQHRGR
jgi:Spy/CpxP family protein refolding chaperone